MAPPCGQILADEELIKITDSPQKDLSGWILKHPQVLKSSK